MNLVVDIGNHSSKFYLFSNGRVSRMKTCGDNHAGELRIFLGKEKIAGSILCSVVDADPELTGIMKTASTFINFSSATPTPLKLSYDSPESLGPDRLAAALAGWQLSQGGSVLTVVAGTCITYNIVTADGNFRGGAIAPGFHMRLNAMHEFTAKLPLVLMMGDRPLTGHNTETSLRSGAINGAVAEVRGMISDYSAEYPALKTVISGGDGAFLAEALKSGIFARPDLVAEGLNTILNYNVSNHLAR